MFYQQICFVSGCPDFVHLDSQGQLHCETGPAMSYPDGSNIE